MYMLLFIMRDAISLKESIDALKSVPFDTIGTSEKKMRSTETDEKSYTFTVCIAQKYN